jgi:hypothetical protein
MQFSAAIAQLHDHQRQGRKMFSGSVGGAYYPIPNTLHLGIGEDSLIVWYAQIGAQVGTLL